MSGAVYLDHNATTPLDGRVREVMAPWMTHVGNPSSVHAHGRAAREAVESARDEVAHFMGAEPEQTLFLASGTECAVTALTGLFLARRHLGRRGVVSAIEHSCVLDAAELLKRRFDAEVVSVPPEPSGRVAVERILAAVDGHTVIVALMAANNETGVVQPVAEVGLALRAFPRAALVVDAVQAAAWGPPDLRAWHAAAVFIAGHKLYGPLGAAALALGPRVKMMPLLPGSQEGGRRGGTENVSAIVGLAEACRIARAEHAAPHHGPRLAALRDELEQRIEASIPHIIIHGRAVPRLPQTSQITFRDAEGEALILGLDLADISVSSGAACQAGSTEPSHVLQAMGLSVADARNSVRFSLGRATTTDDLDYTFAALGPLVERLRSMAPGERLAQRT